MDDDAGKDALTSCYGTAGSDSIRNDPTLPRFPPGRVVATPGALQAPADAGISPRALLARHLRGDWGEMNRHDRRENEWSLAQGLRLLSSYAAGESVRVWIITEADRTATTMLRPEKCGLKGNEKVSIKSADAPL